MHYRLALDLGSTSIGWAMIRLDSQGTPCAVIRAGVRIFSDGRRPKDKASLAVDRRAARAMRRRRDRMLRRKARLMRQLVDFGFFPEDAAVRKQLVDLNPYELRARALDDPLTGAEFARALFHLNQRRGFKSNRRTDKKDSDATPLKQAIADTRKILHGDGTAPQARTVGEYLWHRMRDGQPVRARYRELRLTTPEGKARLDKRYDLYIDRAMVEQEFDAIWKAQARLTPALFTETARAALKDTLLFQRRLRPVEPGRCTLLPEYPRAPLALPSTQRFRIYQEVNNLRIVDALLSERPLTLAERDTLVHALERRAKVKFDSMRKLLKLSGDSRFNLEDVKRSELKGNLTTAILAKAQHFGDRWFSLTLAQQDAIVARLVEEESEAALVAFLEQHWQCETGAAQRIAELALPDGYGSLSQQALDRVLPHLADAVVSFADAARLAGFHHSQLQANTAVPGVTIELEGVNLETGELRTWHVFRALPYYGMVLQRHVGFGTGSESDPPEKRYGKIANPTVHIGLNQLRLVVNAIINRYGHPREVVLEVARDLKQSQEERDNENRRQADNQKRNERCRQTVASTLGIPTHAVKTADIQKLILWEELSADALDRRCPYSGKQIGVAELLSDAVEIEHILPFSRTLDDSLNNKTVAFRVGNRIKGNRTPWEARADFEAQGWSHEEMLVRASRMPRQKSYRFAEHGYQQWLRDDKDFLARALNDTRYLSRVAREYVSLMCPQATRVIPGRMTALLRGKFGLNDVLGVTGAKNRNDHRHHAVDACVIGVTDQGLLERFASASASTRQAHLDRLVDDMPLPWPTYRDHVERAVNRIWVSHRPDHSHEGAMHNDTAYGLREGGIAVTHKRVDGKRQKQEQVLSVIAMSEPTQLARHGVLPDGSPKPYKGYKGDSNYCIEIVRADNGKWQGEVVSTFDAYQAVKRAGTTEVLRRKDKSLRGRPLVMRLLINDVIRYNGEDALKTVRVVKISSDGQVTVAPLHESNVAKRNNDPNDGFVLTSKSAGRLQTAAGRLVSVSPIGDLRDVGFCD